MRPLYLRLRNFKGIKSGTGSDEIEIDFTQLPDGLIAFDGPNGSGKTTVLDSMTPYRLMPYRAGESYSPKAFSYYDNIYGNDACKELIFEMDGKRYRSLINVDADRKKQEAYLFYELNGSWIPLNGDGKTESYDQAVESIAGSPRLFFTSIFRCQGAKSLSDYTKGDMKDLFVELLCIDDLKVKSEKAKAVKSALIVQRDILLSEMRRLDEIISSENIKRAEQQDILTKIETAASEILSKEKEIQDTEKQIQDLKLKISLQEESLKDKTRLEGDIQVKEKKINSARKLIGLASALKKKAEEETNWISEAEAIKNQIQSLDEQFVSLNRELSELNRVESLVKDKEKELQGIRLSKRHSVELLEKSLQDAVKTAQKLENAPCFNMDIAQSCMFIRDAVDARKSIVSLKEALKRARKSEPEEARITGELERLKTSIAGKPSLESQIKKALKQKESLNNRLSVTEKELASVREALKTLPEVELAQKLLPEYEAEVEEIRRKLSKIVIDETLEDTKKKLQRLLLTTRGNLELMRKKEAELRKTLGAIEEAIRQIEESKTKLNSVKAKRDYFNTEISEWALLEKALGNDGLIALEIDDAGPTISAITNDLLLTCFGPRFSVRIDTQGMKADRKSTKEVFDITVFDAERNEVKSIKQMSGGEKTWIEDAITKAICLYNKQRSNKTFLTIFTDEKDGALDMEKKKDFFAMKKRVLEIGGYEREFCITQTPELQELADGRVTFSEKGISIF